MSNFPTLNIPDGAWSRWHDGTHLTTIVVVNGVPCHLNAFAVHIDADDVQRADITDSALREMYDELSETFGQCGLWEPTEIDGRSYVFFMSPVT
jgi:hypothetical protein